MRSGGLKFAGFDGEYDVSLVAGSLQACAVGRVASLVGLSACTGFAAGPLFARGHGFARSKTAEVVWFASSSRIDLQCLLHGAWSASLGLVMLAPLRDTHIVLRDSQGRLVQNASLSGPSLGIFAGPRLSF